jgi:thiamine pyrophosphate-dependent acetolactate synthase large subunit-like protein
VLDFNDTDFAAIAKAFGATERALKTSHEIKDASGMP